jgi:hypothetical protein
MNLWTIGATIAAGIIDAMLANTVEDEAARRDLLPTWVAALLNR